MHKPRVLLALFFAVYAPVTASTLFGRPTPWRLKHTPRRADISLSDSDDAAKFCRWMQECTPPGSEPRPYTLVDSSARTLPAALADIWSSVASMLYAPKSNAPSLTVVLLSGVPELRDVETMHALDHHLKACRDCCVNGLGTRLRLQCLHPEIASGPSAPPFPFVTLTTRVGPSQLRPPQLDWEDQSAAGSNERPPAGMSSRPLGDGSIFGAGPMGEESADLVAVRAALERLLAAGPSAGDGSLPIDGAPPPLEAATSPTAGSLLESRPLPAGPTEPPAPPPSPEELLDAAVSWFGVHFSRVARVVAGRQRRRIVASGQSEDIYAAVWAEAATLYEARRGRERFPTPPRIAPPPTATGGTATGAGGNAVHAGAAAATDNEVWDADAGAASSEAEGVPLSSLLVLPPRADADADDALDFRKLLSSLTLGLAMLGLADRLHLSAIHPRDTFHMQTLDDGSRSWRTTLTVPIMHVVASAATDPSAAP